MSTAPVQKAPAAPAPAKKVESKEKYATMLVGISKSREALHKSLTDLADKLGAKTGHLVWFAVEQMMKKPPTSAADLGIPVVARSTSTVGVGSAPGFWVQAVVENGKTVGVKVVEVAKRPDAQGREFYRYAVVTEGDDAKAITAKNRARAKGQALRGAQADLQFLGVKGDVAVIELK